MDVTVNIYGRMFHANNNMLCSRIEKVVKDEEVEAEKNDESALETLKAEMLKLY